ncbi:hypothetical protein [Nocardia suismassiliense]|uniref:hypothetical protein n=1 Tax=Nocardia suismassiliense TaxID=2077092 RepID=UPI000D1F7C4F|nr:hypothetical protein [Nocardia suismassiliense]
MTSPTYRDDWIDGLLDQGRAEGEAKMLLRVLAARGFAVSDELRIRVESCLDTVQLEEWGDMAMAADSLDAIFGN